MAASRKLQPIDLAKRVATFVAARVPESAQIAVGLSGGCDSVVLLHALTQPGIKDRLRAVHVHHGLSANADAWAEFSMHYCGQLGIPCEIHKVRVTSVAGEGIEAAARAARYAVFSSLDIETVFLAQHQGDQAETVLFNLLRGAGVAGLAAMRPERQHGTLRIFRPWLDISRDEIEGYARHHQLKWVEDESNSDSRFTRNFLRHDVLPVIQQRFPAANAMLAQVASHCREAEQLLEELAAADWAVTADEAALRLKDFRLLSEPRARNLIRYRLRQLGWRVPSSDRLDEFVRQLQTAGPDRHPELVLPDGIMRAGRGNLRWLTGK